MENNKPSVPSSDSSLVIKFGLSVILIVFVFIGGWSSYAQLKASSVAIGKVSADSAKKVVQHLEGGIVDTIYVKDGDNVKKGDLLLKLKEVQIKAQLDILNSRYQDALGLYARLNAHEKGETKIVFPQELKNKMVRDNQINVFNTIVKSLKDEKKINETQIQQLINQSKGLKSIIKSKQSRLDSINSEIKELEVLYKEKLIDKIKIRELNRERDTLEGDIANVISELSRIKEQELEIKIQQLLREKEFKKENLNMLIKIEAEISDIKSKIIALNDTLKRTTIVSPISGTVVGLDIHTIGAVIPPGTSILEIVPQNSKLIVVCQVQTTDIDKVVPGLFADIRFSAFNLNQAHVVEGKVVHVSADSFVDKISGLPYYEAKVEVTKKGREQLTKYGFNLVSGMPAEVMINIGNRTPLSYFVKPFTRMLQKAFNEE